VKGVVIPGGESTTIGKLMTEYEFRERIRELIHNGIAVFGTCAGMILLAKRVNGCDVEPLSAMDIDVRRNAFGRQVDSFETELSVPLLGEKPFPGVFIRAPRVERVGDGVQVLARLPDDAPVAAREGNLLACTFHPELTADTRFHEYFLNLVHNA
jgi:5'-phosphate synthase pdxT subunit